jgi:hypothetical protein
LAQPQPQKRARCSTVVFPELFMFREVKSRFILLTAVAPPPYLPLDVTDWLKEDVKFFDGGFLMGN